VNGALNPANQVLDSCTATSWPPPHTQAHLPQRVGAPSEDVAARRHSHAVLVGGRHRHHARPQAGHAPRRGLAVGGVAQLAVPVAAHGEHLASRGAQQGVVLAGGHRRHLPPPQPRHEQRRDDGALPRVDLGIRMACRGGGGGAVRPPATAGRPMAGYCTHPLNRASMRALQNASRHLHRLTQAPAAAPAPGQQAPVGGDGGRVELGGRHRRHLLVVQALQAGGVLLQVGGACAQGVVAAVACVE
jgi:hypothetical protein